MKKIMLVLALFCSSSLILPNKVAGKKAQNIHQKQYPILFIDHNRVFNIDTGCLEYRMHISKYYNFCDRHYGRVNGAISGSGCKQCLCDCNEQCSEMRKASLEWTATNEHMTLMAKDIAAKIAQEYGAYAVIECPIFYCVDPECDITDRVIYELNKGYIKKL